MKMGFQKPPNQPPKPNLPSPNHQYFKTQNRWSNWKVVKNSCPVPCISSHKIISMPFLKMEFWQSTSQLLKPTLPSLNHQDFKTQYILSSWTVFNNSCSAPGRFSHQTILMALMNIKLKKLPTQPLNPTLTSPTHQYLKTQHRWSSWSVVTNSCPNPGRFSPQTILILSDQLITSCMNQAFAFNKGVLPMILTNLKKHKKWSVKCGYLWREK